MTENVGTIENRKAADEFLADIYTEENKELRSALEQYLGEHSSIYDVVNEIKNGNQDAARELKLAQLRAQKAQIGKQYSSQIYQNEQDIGKLYNSYDNYSYKNGWRAVGDAAAMGLGGAAVGFGFGAGSGALLSAAAAALAGGAATGPMGVIVGGIAGAVLGLVGGIIAGIETYKIKKQEEEAKHAREAQWQALTYAGKIKDVEETRAKAEAAGNETVVEKCNELLEALIAQKGLINQIINEINEITKQEALLESTIEINGEEVHLDELSLAQLKNLGRDAVIEAYAKQLQEKGILGVNLFDSDGNLTDAGYQYALASLKQQDNDAINGILSGGSYTLSEMMKLPNGKTKDEYLKNFATALNMTVEDLIAMEDVFGSLKYNEAIMSPQELRETTTGYIDLLSAITTGAGNTSEWMQTIIGQYPELIAYMGDTSELFSQITKKLTALSNTYLWSQYDDIIGSAEAFNVLKSNAEGTGLYDRLSPELTAELDKFNVTSISSLLDWINQQYDAEGNLSGNGQLVLDALKETVDEYGMQVTSDLLKSYYEQIIDFRIKTIDKELENLNAQKEALQEINSQREYENKLIEAKLKLENASKEKKRVYRAGVGWVYEADQAAIAEAQKAVEELENQKTLAELERQIAELEYDKEKLSNIFDEQNNEILKSLYEDYIEQNKLENASAEKLLESIKEGAAGITEKLSELIQQDSDTAKQEKINALAAAKKAWENLQKSDAANYNTNLEAYHSAYTAAVNAGATEEDMKGWGTTGVNGDETSA